MAQTHKLSLLSASLININIMLGTGIFINTVVLTKETGSLSAFMYLGVALLLLPLILTIGKLIHYHPKSGTFYDFGLSVSPFFGFLNSWSYFIGKLGTAALGIHVCISFLQHIIPALRAIPILPFDACVIVLFALLNLLNLKMGQAIQYAFISIKLIPLFFVIFAGLFLISGAHFTAEAFQFQGVPLAMPFIIYAYTGFEASTSLSTRIENPKKNAARAIFISYGVVVTILVLFQLMFYGALGTALGALPAGYLDAFPAFLSKITFSAPVRNIVQTVLHLAIASSSLGASYGIMYSNSWNLYTLAQNDHTFAKKLLTSFNIHGMPYACILVEGFLALIYLFITQGNQVPLQQVSALGVTISYTLSSIALLVLTLKNKKVISKLSIFSLISCAFFFSSFIWTITVSGPTLMLMTFIGLMIFGSFMFYRKHQQQSPDIKVFEDLF